jgi:uncharacterized membrane protein
MASYLLPIGLILLFIAIAFIIIGSIASSGKTETKVAVGGVIGFIPFGFANDKKMLWFAMIFTAVLFVFFILMRFFWR